MSRYFNCRCDSNNKEEDNGQNVTSVNKLDMFYRNL